MFAAPVCGHTADHSQHQTLLHIAALGRFLRDNQRIPPHRLACMSREYTAPLSTLLANYALADLFNVARQRLRLRASDHDHDAEITCVDAGAHCTPPTEWWLKDDHGNVVRSKNGAPVMNCSNEAASAWWRSIPLKGDTGHGTYVDKSSSFSH